MDNIKMDLTKGVDLDKDRDQWQALVNIIMNLQAP
jgi:hypothetical protein